MKTAKCPMCNTILRISNPKEGAIGDCPTCNAPLVMRNGKVEIDLRESVILAAPPTQLWYKSEESTK